MKAALIPAQYHSSSMHFGTLHAIQRVFWVTWFVVAKTSQFICLTTSRGQFAAAGVIVSMAISFNTVAPALTEVQKILLATIPVIKPLKFCELLNRLWQDVILVMLRGRSEVWSSGSMENLVVVNIKRKKEIELSSQSKLSGMNWNMLSLVFFWTFVCPCNTVLFSKIGRIKLDAVWVAVNVTSVMTWQVAVLEGTLWHSRFTLCFTIVKSSGIDYLLGPWFLIDLILLAALWPWWYFGLVTEMNTRDILWTAKAAGVCGWQTNHLHVRTV